MLFKGKFIEPTSRASFLTRYSPEFEMRQSVLGRRAQMAGEIGNLVAGGKLKRVDDSDPPPVDEHTFIQVKFNEPPPPRAPSPEPYVPPPVQVYTPAPTPAPGTAVASLTGAVKVSTPPASNHGIGGTAGMLDNSDFQKMADELHIRVQTVEKRWKMGAQGFQQYAVMQIRWIVRYVNERFNINDPSVSQASPNIPGPNRKDKGRIGGLAHASPARPGYVGRFSLHRHKAET